MASQLIIQICLARLLAPTDFGLMAMLMILTSVGLVFAEGGFGIALIHHKNASREDESSVFFCNLGLATGVYSVLWLFAPRVAGFYGYSSLEPLLRFSALSVVLGAFGVVQNSVLSRSLDFKALSIVNLFSGVSAGGIAIAMAWNGYGVWCLAWQFVLTSAFRSALLWWMSPWRPLFSFRYQAIQRMGAYGSRLVGSNILSTVFENLNQLLIGKFYTASDLGFYSRALTMQSIPVNTFSQAVGSVLLPAFVHLNDQPEEFRKGYRRAIRCSMAVAVPMMGILGLLAEPIFLLMLSDKWLPAVPFFQIFCISGILYPLHLLNINTLLAQGKPDLYFRLELIKRIVGLCGAAIALPFGVMPLAQSTIVVSAVCLVINTHYTRKLVSYGMIAQLRDSMPFFASLAVSAPLSWAALHQAGGNPWLQIAVGGVTMISAYLALSWLLARDTYQFIRRSVLQSRNS
jgi:teichuronic acid exporter